jgi:uracil-DNA glycosylase
MLRPRLVLAVGKLAIRQFHPFEKLVDVVGREVEVKRVGHTMSLLPLPHPSGASTWHRMEPGQTLLKDALKILSTHPAVAEASAL